MSGLYDNIRKVHPYTPGEQPTGQVIKLNTNENPYPPSKMVEKALHDIDTSRLALYPDSTASKLLNTLGDYYEIPPEQIFVGVGSDDVLAMSFLTFFNSKKEILFPDISYSFYKVWAKLYGIPYRMVQVDEEFQIHAADYYGENGGIVIANPNAPTSLYADLSVIEDILNHNKDVVVIIDEAYIDFAGESARTLLKQYNNLLVVQTCSKSRSMAGMRIGYAFGSKELIGYLQDAKYSFNSYTLNLPAIETGVASFLDREYFEVCTKKIIRTREKTIKQLLSIGFQVLPSSTNFLFARHPYYHAQDLFLAAKEAGIYIRYWKEARIDEYVRITIGTDKQMETLVAFLRQYINTHKEII